MPASLAVATVEAGQLPLLCCHAHTPADRLNPLPHPLVFFFLCPKPPPPLSFCCHPWVTMSSSGNCLGRKLRRLSSALMARARPSIPWRGTTTVRVHACPSAHRLCCASEKAQGPCPPHSLSFSDTPSSSRALNADQVLVTGGSDGMLCLSHESGHLLGTLPSKRSSVVDASQVEALRALLQPPCPAAAQPFR